MTAILETLRASAPALWIEVSPPRGINPDLLLNHLAPLKGHVDAINLTDNAQGRVKMSALVFASILKQRLGLPVVLNLSCRDRNLLALKSELLGAGAIGIDAVVALTGDKLDHTPHKGARPVRDIDAFGLLHVIGEINRGDTGEGRAPLKRLPTLVPGAVANPNRANLDREFELLERKVQSGAQFVITQPVFDVATARRFLDRAHSFNLHVVLGILPVKRESMAAYLKDRIADLREAAPHLDRYAGLSDEQARRLSIEENLRLMRKLAPDAAGFNIMSGGGPSLAIELALEFSGWRKAAGH